MTNRIFNLVRKNEKLIITLKFHTNQKNWKKRNIVMAVMKSYIILC